MKQDTSKERILAASSRLFQSQGYHATGLNQIIQESGAPKGSLYHYFPGGKEQLAIEALNRGRMFITQRLRSHMESDLSPIEALQALLTAFIAAMENSEFAGGMSVANIALDTANTSEGIRMACAEAYDEWIGVIGAKLISHGMEANKASEIAHILHAIIEGSFIIAIVQRDSAIFHMLIKRLPQLLQ
ncbi:MAG: TetR/AcrR family transcriptional regulator [Gorillibacterium sp.]|nr:TetR/AcrR family transcriptional regulator [Gorillibacterium sp.]